MILSQSYPIRIIIDSIPSITEANHRDTSAMSSLSLTKEKDVNMSKGVPINNLNDELLGKINTS